MRLLQPQMLWFLTLLAPLAAIYLLKVRPTRRITTTLFLWDEILQEKRASALFRRLRDLLSLLLLAAAFSAICLAMARPTFVSRQASRDLVLVIDTSASMSAADGGQTRLDRAKKVAREIIEAKDINRRVILASVAHDVRTLVEMTSNERVLIEGFERVEQTSQAFRPEAIESLRANAQLRENYRTILITDGCFEGATLGEGVELLKVGDSAENIGIVAFDVARIPTAEARLDVFFQLVSSFKQPREIDVLVCRDRGENILKVVPVTVQPGENKGQVLHLDGALPGKWLLKLDIKDAMSKDNEAYAVVRPPRPIPVAINAQQSGAFFARCVEAFGGRREVMSLVRSGAELAITSGRAVETAAAGSHIIFNPSGESPFWRKLGEVSDPQPVRVKIPDHPAMRFCDLEAVSFEGARQIAPASGSVILVETIDGLPLVYKTVADGKTAYVVNLNPETSEFVLSAWFPVMVYSMARDLAGREMDMPSTLRPSQYISVAHRSAQPRLLVSPAGAETEFRGEKIGPLENPGFYELRDGEQTQAFACSLLDRNESSLDNAAVVETAGTIERGWPISQILIVVAFCVLAGESVLYHRRRVG